MLIEDQAHCFREIGKLSIDQAQMECYEDFYNNMLRFVGKELDCGECSLENYNRFDNFCGKLIHYNNKNIQFTTFIPRENSTELFWTMCENNGKNDSNEEPILKAEFSTIKSIDEEIKEKGIKRLCENIEFKYFKDIKQLAPRYKVIFGPGEFPIMIFKIGRIGNKDYFWYTISR